MFGLHRTSSLIWPTPATSHISLPRWTLMCLLQANIAMVFITATASERHADTLTFRQLDTEETTLWQRALALRPRRFEFNPQYKQYTNKKAGHGCSRFWLTLQLEYEESEYEIPWTASLVKTASLWFTETLQVSKVKDDREDTFKSFMGSECMFSLMLTCIQSIHVVYIFTTCANTLNK